jgi:predicted small lipoprotein YifL
MQLRGSPAITMPWTVELKCREKDPDTLPLASMCASRYGAATFRSLSMSSSLTFSRAVVVAGLLVLSLSACGRRGALEPPPDASVPQVQQQGNANQATLPSPVGTPRSKASRGYTVPDRPFILDPLL